MLSALFSRRRAAESAAVAALVLVLSDGSEALTQPTPLASTDAFARILLDSYPGDKPGAAAIVVKDGKTLFRKASGMADLELSVPLQPDMVFRLGSITKQFTATAILMLAEEGKLSLQDPIEKVLPDYPTQGHVITVEHLLTHTSGIRSYTGIPGWMDSKILSPMSVSELIDGFKKEPMEFAPGTKWAYNNSAYVILGAIIEKASGKTYEAFVKERIFDPLGMTSSFYGSNDPIIPKRVPGYSMDGDKLMNARYLSMTQPYSAGSLSSSVDDLARWDASLYTEKLLKKASLEKAWTPYVLTNGESTGYGYGWGIGKLRGRTSISHGGGIFGFSTFAIRLPEDHVYVAVLANSDSPVTDPGYVARKLAAMAAGKPFPEFVAITLDPRLLDRYAGVYEVDKKTTRTVTVEGNRIYTQRSGGSRMEIRPSSETEFFYDKSFTHLRFVLDSGGAVTEMLMYPDGAEEAEHARRTGDAPEPPMAAKVDPGLYDAYVGNFELAPGFIIAVTREGDRLMTQATGQQKFEIFPKSETEFFLKVVDAQITFVRSPGGAVDQLVLHQGGRDVPGKRVK